MKTFTKILLVAVLSGLSFTVSAQQDHQINLKVSRNKVSIRSVNFFFDNVLIYVDANGRASILPPEKGAFDYYTPTDGEYRNGKLRSAGNTVINYYDVFDGDASKIGKIKSVGTVGITYYDKFDGFDNIGKLKAVGNITFTYYDRFDGDENLLGRLKTVGNDRITYYTKFDGGDNIGKLKSVGNTTITYFDRFDGGDNQGKVKSIKGNTKGVNVINEGI